ncbi:hypothetical protein [Nocardia vaccinii]|uniref:hypothetical protein n=1 Tax=Nocardia vaccinii TaxID=1822 RepID=UPI000B325668|nr:hypothetical protein [Nocardia vaccinii]
MPRNENDPSREWGSPRTPPGPDQDSVPELDLDADPAPQSPAEDGWYQPPPEREQPHSPHARRGGGRGLRLRGWAALVALAAVTIGVLAATHTTHQPGPRTSPATVLRAGTTTPASGVCAGLSGAVVTTSAGNPATLEGVIATFEAAYYSARSAPDALRVVAPEAGITEQGLAAGIASIPPGTTHCVAITPVTANTATVHLVELHPDQHRVDYLQVINTIPAPNPGGGLLISHVQEQG